MITNTSNIIEIRAAGRPRGADCANYQSHSDSQRRINRQAWRVVFINSSGQIDSALVCCDCADRLEDAK